MVAKLLLFTSDVAQNALTTAGTLSLPSARNVTQKPPKRMLSLHSTETKCQRLQSALLVVMCILYNCYL